MEQDKNEIDTVLGKVNLNKKCPDFDTDCNKVDNHIACFIGGDRIGRTGILTRTETAKGYCPFIHTPN